MIQGWFPDINTNAAANNTGFYTRKGYLIRNPIQKEASNVPFQCDTYSGFVDDKSKETYRLRDTLQLILKQDNDALFRTAAAGKVVLSKLAWYVPIVQPNDVRKVNLYKSIASNTVMPVLTEGVVDLTVRMGFSDNVPANTQAYTLVTSDRMLKFKSDGSKMIKF